MTSDPSASVVKREVLGVRNLDGDPRSDHHHALAPVAGLSSLDRGVIALLQTDGRMPFARLARELEVTDKTARRRVQELIARGVIQITTVADPEVLGYEAIALVAVRVDTTRSTADMATALASLTAVDYVLVATGRYQIMVELICRDLAELADVVDREIAAMPGVADYEIYPYLHLHYQEPRFQTARWKPTDHRGIQHQVEALDDVDLLILRELNLDGRIAFQTIARNIGISEAQVRHRFNAMLDGGSVRVLAITNPRSMGFEALAWIGVTVAPRVGRRELAERLAALPSVTYVAICTGRFDLLAEMVCTNQYDLLAVLDEQVASVEGIARVETFVCVDLHYKRVVAATNQPAIE